MDANDFIQRTFKLNKSYYEEFKDKAKDEGYTVDDAINALIIMYVRG